MKAVLIVVVLMCLLGIALSDEIVVHTCPITGMSELDHVKNMTPSEPPTSPDNVSAGNNTSDGGNL